MHKNIKSLEAQLEYVFKDKALIIEALTHKSYKQAYDNERLDFLGDAVLDLIVGEYLFKHGRNFFKRIFYNYYLRDMSLASIELPLGLVLVVSGLFFGIYHWINSLQEGVFTSAGTVMLAALPMLFGFQLILAFLGYDISNVPRRPLHTSYRNLKNTGGGNGE